MKRRDGVSRRFAFVGFKTIEDATKALKFFDKTFFDTSRLKVEVALPVGDRSLPRAWSRHTAGSSAYNREHGIDAGATAGKEQTDGQKSAAAGDKEEMSDEKKAKFDDFLSIMKPRSKGGKWSNDTNIPEVSIPLQEGNEKEKTPQPDDNDSSSDDEEYEDVKPRFHRGGDDDESSSSDSDSSDDDDDKGEKVDGGKPEMSDMDFLRSKVSTSDRVTDPSKGKTDGGSGSSSSSSSSSDSDSSSSSDSEDDEPAPAKKPEKPAEKDEKEATGKEGTEDEAEKIEDSGRLFVRNIPFSTTEDDLRELFSAHGALTEVHLPLDNNNKSRGFGYITYVVPENAVMAMSALDGSIFQGRLVHILPARKSRNLKDDEEDDDDGGNQGKSSSYKKKQQEEAKRAANDDSNWNPIYMRSDTVVGAIADKYGMKKGDILDTEASNLAVRVALGEAHIIEETKGFLSDNGVSTEALETAGRGNKVKRSKTVLLVKNLPADTDVPELRQMFTKHGEISRFVVPPSKVLGLVEYVNKINAKRAFRSLAYKRYKRVPLYLEWAPEGSFMAAAPASVKEGEAPSATHEEVSNSVFVKNLSFNTSEVALKAHFEKVVSVRNVKIPRKGGNKNLSMGFGFVELATVDDARKVMKRLQGSFLDGHTLDLKLSAAKQTEATVKGGAKRKKMHLSNPNGTKLAIKNLAFEATRNDLRELFGAFGQIKSVRIPRKFDGSHRGFGFVDFLTHEEALNSMSSLSSAHLYGRHLVIDWAEAHDDDEDEGDDADELEVERHTKRAKR